MSKMLVVKANNIIEASYQLSLNEQRLILAAISCIPKGEEVTDNTGYCVTRESFIELGINPKTASREIREACDRLFNRVITITTEAGTFKTRWVQDIMKFSKSVLPFISNLSSNFTQYFLQDIAGVSSGYSIRFYELMMQFKSTGYRKIRLDDLRNMLDLNDKYPLTADLKRRVIDTAIDELNEKSPIKITYKLLKTGRKFTHLELKFKPKVEEKTKEIDSKKDPNNPEFFIKLSDPQRHMFASKMSEMPEMSSYSQGTESYQQFAVRIAEMLLQPEKFREFYPLLTKLGYK